MDKTKTFDPAASDANVASGESIPAAATAATPQTTRRGRGLLITGGALLTAIVLTGGGFAVGAAVADGDDHGYEHDYYDRDDDFDDARTSLQRETPTTPGAIYGAASADELVSILDAAASVAPGEPVSIDLRKNGSAIVTLATTDGGETDVQVAPDGQASVISTERPDWDDAAPKYTLDATSIRAIIAAALAQTPGRIIDIDTDDDMTSPYDVTVLTDDRRIVEIDLDANYDVLHTDTDTDTDD